MTPLLTKAVALPAIALLMISFLPKAKADRHKQVAAANSHCTLDCLNDGYCSFTKYTDYPSKGDVGYYQSCTCRPGFGGGSCEKVIEECQPPYYKCHNGAPCEISDNEKLSCDCSFADAKSELAGYMCRKPVIQACDTLDENNKSFCTNGGVCLSSMTASPNNLMFSRPTVHEGCQCDDAFSGDHCELLKDMPESSLVEKASPGASGGAEAGITITLFVVAGILVAILIIRRKRRQHQVLLVQPRNNGDEAFHKLYQDKVGKSGTADEYENQDNVSKNGMRPDDDILSDDGGLQLGLERIDFNPESMTFEAGVEPKIV